MRSDWKHLTIGELVQMGEASVQTGPFGSQLHKHDYIDDGVPVIPTEAIGRGRILDVDVPKISKIKANELSRHKLLLGDILFARRGAQATGLSAIVDSRYVGAICGTGALLLRVNSGRVDPFYLSMFLSSTQAFEWLRAHAVGAVMPNLNTNIIKALPIALPGLSEQRRLAAFYDALGDRITLLTETNATLKDLGQALFKSWFIDFEPVRAKANGGEPRGMDGATAALFPSSFENSQLGLMPRGWKVGGLGEILTLRNERTQPSEKTKSLPYVPIESIGAKNPFLYETKLGDEASSSLTLFRKGDILFGAMRPYFHKVCVAPFDGVTRTTVLTFIAKNTNARSFALFLAYQASTIKYATQHSEGSTIPYAKWKNSLEYMPVVLPPISVQEAFGNVVSLFIEQANANNQQVKTLVQLRNSLLPRLISGRMRLPETEASIEDTLSEAI